jgi:predicted DNA-binding transcriptional regulator AlpA
MANKLKPHPSHSPSLPQGLEYFEKLPDSAYVALAVVCGIYDCSSATIWRRVKDGDIVPPVKLGKRTTRWQVGELRKCLAQASLVNFHQGE